MVGRTDLNPAGRRRLLALVAVVLLAHVLGLHALSRWLPGGERLRAMAEPMYTRLLQPQAPEPPPAVQVAVAPPAAPQRMRASPSVPPKATGTLPAAEPAPEARAAPDAEPPATSPPKNQTAEPLPEPAPVAADAPVPEPALPQPSLAQPESPAGPAAAAAAASDPAPPAAGTAAAPGPATSAPDTGLDGWPADTRLRYTLGGRFRSGDLYGQARVLWQREGARYQVRVEVDVTLFATLVMTSQGEVGAQALQPRAYEEVRNRKSRGLLRMGEGEVLLPNGKVLPRPPQLQDTASQFVELSHRFASGRERLEVGRAVSFWMARPGAVDLWTYDIVGQERLVTALGDVDAFHLKPRPIANPRGNITMELWFAPALQYLPVRVRVNMGEEAHVDLLVEAIDQR
ncbi:DUF3108 domain-containing protein [Ramlibacter tataouinensis]|uniref:DUF3108 domain-containing protein n=1 Tax=Ramlibacter tataouinensis TaxID=94132 RepID=UPI0022F3D2F4|nr:DUF3108 domain-containing protein [Ramlibacter tataouinensis]WBY03725.1 DUF3108 domain-containing protein [Ramlibacter tataouinensis]